MRRGTDRQINTQTAVTNIHFASVTPHAKCNYLTHTAAKLSPRGPRGIVCEMLNKWADAETVNKYKVVNIHYTSMQPFNTAWNNFQRNNQKTHKMTCYNAMFMQRLHILCKLARSYNNNKTVISSHHHHRPCLTNSWQNATYTMVNKSKNS